MTERTALEAERGLSRSLGVRELTASIITITIGGGVFLLPAGVATTLGAAAWVAYVVCAVVFGLIVLCFAEAGSRVSLSGGPYAYVEHAFGPFVGYLGGVLVLLFGTLGHAAVAAGFTQAINALVPGAGVGVAGGVLIVVVFAFFTFVNLRGVGQGARVVEIGTVVKLVPLVFIGTVGLFAVNRANLAWPGMPPLGDLTRTSMTLMFAFFGVETALVPSGEVRDSARTVPRAILFGVGAVTLLYLGVQLSAQGILGPDLVNHPDAPLAAAAEKGFGRWAGLLLMIGAAVSMVAHTSGMMLAMPRGVFAMSRDGFLPGALARVNAKTHVPTHAILAYAAVVTALAASGTFLTLVQLANISALLMYLLCCLGVIGLRRRQVRLEAEPFTIPGGAIVPWLASAAILALLSTATLGEVKAVGVALLVAVALYVLRARRGGSAATTA
ncbi:MAG: APC family permease [Longimicrobiales bacterium]|nr:APC family permease [Longimicrobiales bacterium]